MKKLIYSLAIAGGLILFTTDGVIAQGKVQKKAPVTQTSGSGFIDANGDGICDNYDGERPGQGKGPGNGQGLGRSTGKGLGKGQGLRDGSCTGQRLLDGTGLGRGQGNGQRLRDGSGGNCPAPTK